MYSPFTMCIVTHLSGMLIHPLLDFFSLLVLVQKSHFRSLFSQYQDNSKSAVVYFFVLFLLLLVLISSVAPTETFLVGSSGFFFFGLLWGVSYLDMLYSSVLYIWGNLSFGSATNLDSGGEMGEISSEMKSVPMENNVVIQNSYEFRRLVLGKQVLAAGQGDHVNGQQQQQLLHQGLDNNTLLALQEIPGNPATFKANRVVGNEGVRKVKEKPKLTVTDEKKPRLRWTKELHAYFVDVCNWLGGPNRATPKAILDLMDIDGLNVYHIKSHLQKYRLGKYADKELTEAGNTGSSSSVTPSNSVPYGNRRGRRNSKNRNGELYLKLEAEKYVRMYLEAQRRYLYTALEHACNKLAGQHLDHGTMGNLVLYRQALASLGNLTDIPAGPSGFGTSATTTPAFYFNQQNEYPMYNTPTTPANLGLQQTPFGYQQQASSSHTAPQGDFSSSAGYSGSSSYQKTSPTVESNVEWSDDEDPIRALLNWDDDEPKNLDTAF